jgi:hypothetical protein
VTDGKKVKDGEVPLATAGAVRPPAPSKFPRTLVAEPVPPELKARAIERERTIEVSASDADVMIETDPSTTMSELAGGKRVVASQEPTDPGVLRRQRQLRRRMALGAAGGLGVVAVAIAARGIAHRATASRSATSEAASASASASAVASSSPQPAPAAPPTAEPMVATVDSATPPPDAQAPGASSSAKTPAPKTHPARPKHAPNKVVR